MREILRSHERIGIGTGLGEGLAWHAHWRVDKRHGDAAELDLTPAEFRARVEPYEVVEFEGNAVPDIGGAAIWDLVTGEATYTAFDAANAKLGVGDSATAFDHADIDLKAAANFLRKGMNGGYPTYTDMVVTFQADFTGAEANYAWNEVGTFNDITPGAGQMLNRKVQVLGTKGAGSTWTLTLTITLS
jgi:hypothetical protein